MSRLGRYELRAAAWSDADTILAWRNSDRVRQWMLTRHNITYQEHMDWFRSALKSTPPTHFVLEFANKPIGFVHFQYSDLHTAGGGCTYEWSLYIGHQSAPRGSGGVLGYLALEFAFTSLCASAIVSGVFEHNIRARSLYQKLGFIEILPPSTLETCTHHEAPIRRFLLAAETWQVHRQRVLKTIEARAGTEPLP